MSVAIARAGGDSSVDIHNKTTYRNLKRGDLIEFHRGVYSHWAVYIGDDQVIHLAGEENDGLNGNFRPEYVFTISGKTFNKAKVCVDEIWQVVLDSKMFINNAKDSKWSPLHPDEVVKNALSRLGQVGYSLITQNCEHFAKWCRYGVEKSDQVDNFLTGVSIGLAGAAVLGVVGAITKYWNPKRRAQIEDDEDDEDDY